MQKFGGTWTEEKLAKVSAYLTSYSNALKNKGFKRIYIDAFAGTGYRIEELDEEEQTFYDGSAINALKINPGFDRYIFIEKDQKKCQELEKLKESFPEKDIIIVEGDANQEIQKLCNKNWLQANERAVIFLDPFAMAISWATLVKIANTEAMDVWILVPIGAINRMLRKDGRLDDSWNRKLNDFFGSKIWHTEFYAPNPQLSLFGLSSSHIKTADFESISKFFVKRLKTIFPGVAENPKIFYNSKGSPIFLLCFAASNPKGSPIALRIAQHILGK